jgi:dihydrofolate synthase / folylpolyglutamate synthase
MIPSNLTAYLHALSRLIQPIRSTDFPRPLEPMRRLLAALDHPEQAFASIVVAGSVGKGTACIQLASALRQSGLKVGLYTGPHLHSFRERFMVDGTPMTYDSFIRGATAVQQAEQNLSDTYSTFERATALALWWFREQGVQHAVLEIGIGGRLDAVNAVPNRLAVLMPIEMEHAAMLGGSLASIASHKAGIIQPNGLALSVEQVPEVAAVIRAEAQTKQATLQIVPGNDLVKTALEYVGVPFSASNSPLPIHLPSRLEVIERGNQSIVIDGAHTARSAERLRTFVDERFGNSAPIRVIAGILRDKSPSVVLSPFDDPRFRIILTTAPGHRAIPATELQSSANLSQASVEVIPLLESALTSLASALEPVQIVMGSLRMAAVARESLGLLSAEELAEAQATRDLFEGGSYLERLSTR